MRTLTSARHLCGMLGLAIVASLVGTSLASEDRSGRMLEIRSYNLKPGTRDRFHRLFVSVSLPMLQRRNIDVVAYGPSLHDSDSYYLMRSYPSLEERRRSESAFYTSDDWRQGPRAAVLADIEGYTTVVIPVDEATLQALREVSRRAANDRANSD